jgi:ATP-binding cassette, subfamily B, bacterial
MKKEVYKHLLQTYGRLPLLWVAILIEIIRTTIQRIFVVIIVARIISHIAAGNLEAAKSNIILFLFVFCGATVLGLIGELIAIKVTDLKYESLLLGFYRKLVGKDMSFYRDHQTGYLSSLFRQHLDSTMNLVRLFRSEIIRFVISILFPVIVLFIVGWKIGLAAAAVVIIQCAYVLWSSSRVDAYRKQAQEVYKKLTGEVADEVTNAIAFKSSGAETEAQTKVTELAHEEARLFWLRHRMRAFLDFPRMFITGIGVGGGFFVALSDASASAESVGVMVMMFSYMMQIMRNSGDLPDLLNRHDEHISRVYPTLEYLGASHETILDPANPKSFIIKQGSIEIKDVGFKYKAGAWPVFDDLNISIKGGEHVGVVGLSGAGKTTLAGLLLRFDDINSGSIKIDGIDIRDVKQSELRQKIAYIPQEPLLFHRSIRENIAYFKKDATNDEIVRAAKAAHADEFISKLPDAYNATVGERGIKLSGGQKQRIAIARAVLKGAPIMIFDEATSALDSESERIIQNALPEIIGKHTAIVIAHRLSTIARMDRIIVMDGGRIIEEGAHEQLLAKRGRYYSLWQKQGSDLG